MKDSDKIVEKSRELEAIYDVVQEPIVLINEKFRIMRANQSTILFTQKPSFKSVLGAHCFEVLYGRKEICPYCPVAKHQNTVDKSHFLKSRNKGPISREIFFHTNQRKQTLYIEFYPYPKNEGESWIVEKISDITEVKEKDEESLRMRNLASLGILVSGIAHELNNPLTGISLTIQNLQANWSNATSEFITKKLEMIKTDMSRAAMIVSDIISFAKNDRIKVSLGNLVETINRARDTVVRLYPHLCKNIVWNVIFEEEFQFPFHPPKIERLFMNLFRNSLQAFDYRPGEIQIELRKSKEQMHIFVEDNAGGIPEPILKKVFDPFFTNSKSGTGTGLGLSICHSIVREHNGSISVKSHGGKTKFTINLPLQNKEMDSS